MADEPNKRPPVEAIPSVAGGVSAIGSAAAPFIYFDFPSTWGFNPGIGNITLEASRYHVQVDGSVARDRVVVAHLRMGLDAAIQLKKALDAILLLAAPTPEGPAN
jgi:hypothetical protein